MIVDLGYVRHEHFWNTMYWRISAIAAVLNIKKKIDNT